MNHDHPTSSDGDSHSGKQAEEYDPVYGMRVSFDSPHRFERDGRTWDFCSAHCAGRFAAETAAESPLPDETGVAKHGHAPHGGTDHSCCHDAKNDGAHEHSPAPAGTIYLCPMHPEIRQDRPGTCPKCGMALEPELPDPDEGDHPELLDFSRRFRWTLPLTVVGFVLAMFGHRLHLMDMATQSWVELLLSTPLAAGLLYTFTGWLLCPMIAALAMNLSSASVVGNALRLRQYRPNIILHENPNHPNDQN